ncbi:LacI family transcriptional regulator [Sphingomonas sp. Leaf33]|uniref:LacI family DNA-binding transcriptional regulator n=1 Tax=Sphingomonas sp. Leaf33 TaxID=1736215 RepID=UPI0006F791F2|nr:LacI family DNA-binding transcriptional regulator [Sphingomonas sp. Leaf33]KQN26364.1 LacI family transcriptional regulator [Sphingomonas sp. Leaf33]
MASRPASGSTIRDVAASAGVSIRTVSRVLNRSPKVNAETRERVEEIIASLGFRRSARARGLATGRSYLIALLHNDRNALVLDTLQRGVVEAASARGYELVVHPTPAETAEVVDDILDFVARSRVDGLVVMAPVSGIPGLADHLAVAGIPAVAMAAVEIAGFPDMLVSDERGAAAEVARYLRGLGHRRVGLVNGPLDAQSAQERRAGFLGAAQGLEVIEAAGDYGFDAGHAAGVSLLDSDPRPTAIFAVNDVMAAGVLKAAAARGIVVPRELSVVGFDGSMLARMLTPALTSVHRPLADMAASATTRLLDIIEGGGDDTPLTARLVLVEGESSGPAPSA